MPRYSIVGQKFKNLDPYLPGIAAGSPAVLVREPNNPHDAFAVAVYVDDKHVGYIGKRDNVEIARRIDAEGEAYVVVASENGVTFDARPREAAPERRMMRATFQRSPNSAYPQVELDF